MKESRGETYNMLDYKTRFLTRLIIILMTLLSKQLEKYKLTPVFAIVDPDDFKDADEEEKEDLLQ